MSTMEYTDVIMALPKAAAGYLQYIGLIFPLRKSILNSS